jgi:hypothetical protein
LPALQIFQDQRLDQKIPHIPIAIIGTWIFMHGVHGVPSPLFDPCAPDREVAKTVNLFEICAPPRWSGLLASSDAAGERARGGVGGRRRV